MFGIAGIELLPPIPTFLAFALAGLALNIVPGADMTFVIASAARGGRRAGVVAALGIGAGTLVHVGAAVLGLSAILASSEAAFNIIKWVGAAYLLYLAASLVVSGEQQKAAAAVPLQTSWRLFRSAMLVNMLNPKVALFFLAFLPQFVDPNASVPALQILCLGLWFDAVGTLINAIIGIVAAGTAARVRHLSWVRRGARYVAATAMGALAFRLAFADRR